MEQTRVPKYGIETFDENILARVSSYLYVEGFHLHRSDGTVCVLAGCRPMFVRSFEPLSSACCKRQVMEASRSLPAGAIPSVVKV